MNKLSGDEIASELKRLDVTFLMGGEETQVQDAVDPVQLLVSMASSDEARVRMVIIPLMLRRPELSAHVTEAANQLSDEELGFLLCYYTAAVILQKKYADNLAQMALLTHQLPDEFSEELGIATSGDYQQQLEMLASRQAELVGREVNWVGTYEHSATSFLRFHEKRARWRAESNQANYAPS